MILALLTTLFFGPSGLLAQESTGLARAELSSKYSQIIAAIRTKDAAKIGAMETDDFVHRLSKSSSHNKVEEMANNAGFFRQLVHVSEWSFYFESLKFEGASLKATVTQEFTAELSTGKPQAVSKIRVKSTSVDTWVQSNGDWKLKEIIDLRENVKTLN